MKINGTCSNDYASMPPRRREPPLQIGDRVSVAVRFFGESYARDRARNEERRVAWNSDSLRDTGTVVERAQDGQVLVDFNDGEENRWWQRKVVRFVSRTERTRTVRQRCVSSSDNESDTSEENAEQEDVDGSEADACSESSTHDAGDDEAGDTEGWQREDESANDERRRWGSYADSEPVWMHQPKIQAKEDADPDAFFFEVCCSWFDMDFIRHMANKMQEIGRAKGTSWAAWKVTQDDHKILHDM